MLDLEAADSSSLATSASMNLIVYFYLVSLAFLAFSLLRVNLCSCVIISESSELYLFLVNPYAPDALPFMLLISPAQSSFDQTIF